MQQNQAYARMLVIVGVLVLLCALALALTEFSSPVRSSNEAMYVAVGAVLMSAAQSALLFGLARLLSKWSEGPPEGMRLLTRIQQQTTENQTRLEELSVAVDRIARLRAPPPAPAPVGAPVAAPSSTSLDISPLLKMLEEIRDAALLTDDERRGRIRQLSDERKLYFIRHAIGAIESSHWGEASGIVLKLEQEHPTDMDVRRVRQQLEDGRARAEGETVRRIRDQIESHIGIGSWVQAETMARQLSGDFPGNAEARGLLERVVRDRNVFQETTVARMLDEVRNDIDRRLWRRACTHALTLVEKYADHPKTQRLKEQLATLRDNAEIEERQEKEVRIQELIRGRQFHEAIALAEDLLERFPNSPQAEAIEVLLPRIRELADEEHETAA
ncbi:MAG: hypothetical protein ACREJC_06045 [Tepidisphaeraceae bacterium]